MIRIRFQIVYNTGICHTTLCVVLHLSLSSEIVDLAQQPWLLGFFFLLYQQEFCEGSKRDAGGLGQIGNISQAA